MNTTMLRGIRRLRHLLVVTALIGLFGLCMPAARGQAYTNVYGPNFYHPLTNFPITLTAGQTLALTSERMVVSPTRGIGFAMQVHGTNSCTGNVAAGLNVSIDGTTNTQTTTTPYTLLVPLSNTAKQVSGTNVPPSSTGPGNNFRDFVVTSLTNPHTNSIIIDAFWSTKANQ